MPVRSYHLVNEGHLLLKSSGFTGQPIDPLSDQPAARIVYDGSGQRLLLSLRRSGTRTRSGLRVRETRTIPPPDPWLSVLS